MQLVDHPDVRIAASPTTAEGQSNTHTSIVKHVGPMLATSPLNPSAPLGVGKS